MTKISYRVTRKRNSNRENGRNESIDLPILGFRIKLGKMREDNRDGDELLGFCNLILICCCLWIDWLIRFCKFRTQFSVFPSFSLSFFYFSLSFFPFFSLLFFQYISLVCLIPNHEPQFFCLFGYIVFCWYSPISMST